MCDVQSRLIRSLKTGRVLDECDIEDTPEEVMHRDMAEMQDIRVELTLKNALESYRMKDGDVAEIFSQPRVCQAAGGKEYDGIKLRPAWSLDLTMKDPSTGEQWDLSSPKVQRKVRQMVVDGRPYIVIGSPPCT